MSALSIVSHFTGPIPEVDASKYRSWSPDLDKPKKKQMSSLTVKAPPAPLVVKAPSVAAQVRALLERGISAREIARTLGVASEYISAVKYALKKQKQVQAMPVVAVPVVAAPVECPAFVPVDHVTPAPAPVCLPFSPEPPRMFVLDWQRRMSSYSFSDPPAGVIPRRQTKRIKVVVASQVKATGLLGEHAGAFHTGMNPNNTHTSARAINCASPSSGPALTSTDSPRKPLKTRYLSPENEGEKGVDVDVKWREACTP